MINYQRLVLVTVVIPAASLLFGMTAGTALGDDIALKAAKQHDKVVVACVEQAAKRYSCYLGGDQNLIPEWAKSERISMCELDDSYR